MYTRTGDSGLTGLRGGQRLRKDDARVEAYGTVDELNAHIGMACELAVQGMPQTPALGLLVESLRRVQHELFNIGSTLASAPQDRTTGSPAVMDADAKRLELEMDGCSAALAPLSSFVLPGGTPLNAALHLARTVCRRAERRCVAIADEWQVQASILVYLNRLSDALFVWARWASAELGARETLWQAQR